MKNFTLLLCFAIPILCMAQSQLVVQYDYDAAGNRILRKMIELSPQLAPPAPQDSTSSLPHSFTPSPPACFVEKIAQTEIKIYPNPTTEKITLEFSGSDGILPSTSLQLYSLSGQLLQTHTVHSATTAVSLAGLPKGTYMLKVNISGHSETWKIIKH
jgi:hypothetical protein